MPFFLNNNDEQSLLLITLIDFMIVNSNSTNFLQYDAVHERTTFNLVHCAGTVRRNDQNITENLIENIGLLLFRVFERKPTMK